jgi:MEMO1 family protein
MREPYVSGLFYENDKNMLIKQIENSFLSDFGPKKLPDKNNAENNIYGIILPHAGYTFSGPCASHGFLKISSKINNVLIIAPSHNSYNSAFSDEDFKTPLGIIKNNKENTNLVSKETKIPIDNNIHIREHSLEVQLPFLQYINPNIKIIPLLLTSDINPLKIGEKLQKIQHLWDFIIISSDFTHYGPRFGYNPYGYNKEKPKEIDKKAIDLIKKGDIKRLIEYIDKTSATICGINPIICFLSYISNKKYSFKELCYYNSGDISGDYSNVVGYASLIFKKD